MIHVLHPADQRIAANGTIAFEGQPYGAGVSFYLVDAAPGEGPALHRHPYPETWIVRSGKAAMTVDGKEITAGAGDIVVAGPGVPHGFRAIGPDRLSIMCIHASDTFIQEWVRQPS